MKRLQGAATLKPPKPLSLKVSRVLESLEDMSSLSLCSLPGSSQQTCCPLSAPLHLLSGALCRRGQPLCCAHITRGRRACCLRSLRLRARRRRCRPLHHMLHRSVRALLESLIFYHAFDLL